MIAPHIPIKLPTITVRGQTYVVDDRLQQLRNTKDQSDYIDIKEFKEQAAFAILNAVGSKRITPEVEDTIRTITDIDKALGHAPKGNLLADLRKRVRQQSDDQTQQQDQDQ